MGKKNKHSQDKLHKTVSELRSHHLDKSRDLELSNLHRRLKFDSCCLSLNSITGKPYGLCDDDNWCYVFNEESIVKFLEKFQIHPINGKKVTSKDLIRLVFHKNNENQYHCPITFKIFNQHSRIVANKKTGNVYSFEAYQQLNLKPNNLKDLLTDEPFDKDKDIATIQDPDKADAKWSVKDFHYVANNLKINEVGESNIRNESSILKSALEEYKRQSDSIVENFNRIVGQTNQESESEKLDKINSAPHSDGSLSRAVTSTIIPAVSTQTPALLSHEQILYPRIKKKGYVQLVTNFGPINLELFCDRTPKTCHNFMLLASRGYYDNSPFHRLVKNFILQGGDPTGTGSGGQSVWGAPFRDEFHKDLKHVGRGVLAMANSGPGTNKSQFYLTFRGTWENLDGKHTIFGRMVGGDDTLSRIEELEVDKKDRPKKDVTLLRVIKYADPFEEAEAALEEERKREQLGKRGLSGAEPSKPLKKFRSGIGAYIDLNQISKSSSSSSLAPAASNSESKASTIDLPPTSTSTSTAGGTSLANKLAKVGAKGKIGQSQGDFSSW